MCVCTCPVHVTTVLCCHKVFSTQAENGWDHWEFVCLCHPTPTPPFSPLLWLVSPCFLSGPVGTPSLVFLSSPTACLFPCPSSTTPLPPPLIHPSLLATHPLTPLRSWSCQEACRQINVQAPALLIYAGNSMALSLFFSPSSFWRTISLAGLNDSMLFWDLVPSYSRSQKHVSVLHC